MRGVVEVVTTGGDTVLGGDDFDPRLAARFASGTCGGWSSEDTGALHAAARTAKEAPTDRPTVTMQSLRGDGRAEAMTVDRADFKGLTLDLVERALGPIRRALRDAKLKPEQVDGVALVGGANRMPQLRNAVAKVFGREPCTSIDPDQAVLSVLRSGPTIWPATVLAATLCCRSP